jgi:hypothetical protein
MNRRQFVVNTCTAAITSPLLAGSFSNSNITLPKLKDGTTTFKIAVNNMGAFLKNSIFKTHYFRTNLGENSASKLIYGDDVIKMSSTRGYASRLNSNEPLESVISRSLNDLENSIYEIEGCIITDNDTIQIKNILLDDGADISVDGVLDSLYAGVTDAYISAVL